MTAQNPIRVEADYLIETAIDPMQAAEIMAGEQSSGTFRPIPGETAELKIRAAAQVENLKMMEPASEPSLLGSVPSVDQKKWWRAHITLSWPLDNLGPSLPNLITTIAGNLFELQPLSGIRLMDLRLPSAFSTNYAGPKFGSEGTRKLMGIYERPLIGTIIKPSVGLSAKETGKLVSQLCAGGIDFIKDDELQANGPSCPFEDRVIEVMRAVNNAADKMGHKVMVAFNLTGEIDEMRRRHDFVHKQGGTCVMVNLMAAGMAGMIALRHHANLPIHAHRAGWGALTREPLLGWSYPAWSKLWRLAGADHMHVSGLDNKFTEPNESVIESARSLNDPLFKHAPMSALPVFSSGQTVRQAAATLEAVGSSDFLVAAGGGIVAHPGGVAAGVKAMRQAYDAAMQKVDVAKYAEDHPELATALDEF
jgi:ribulose-bisphosphate carboxylase large chain